MLKSGTPTFANGTSHLSSLLWNCAGLDTKILHSIYKLVVLVPYANSDMMFRYLECKDTWMSFVKMSIYGLDFGCSGLMNYHKNQERWIYVSIFRIASFTWSRVRLCGCR